MAGRRGPGGTRLGVWDFITRREVKLLDDGAGILSVHAAFSPAEPLLAYAFTLASSPTGAVHRLRL